jgi:hypothetical protein
VSLHSICSRSMDFWLHHRPTSHITTTATTSSTTSSCDTPFQDPTGYPRILDIIDLRPLWGRHAYKAPCGRLCQTPCSYAWRSGCLFTSFDQDHDPTFFSFRSIKPAMLPTSIPGDYSTSALCFSSSNPHDGKPVSHHVVARSTMFSSSIFWTIIPAILPATMLGYHS